MKSFPLFSFVSPAYADGASTPTTTTAQSTGTPPAQPNPIMSVAPLLLMLGVVYFLIIRPQQKKMKEHQETLSKLTSGEEVVTQAGIFGTVVGLSDKVVTLEVDKNVRIKVLKSQIAGPVQNKVAESSKK